MGEVPITVFPYNEELEVDANGYVLYHGFCKARPNTETAKANAIWKIKKFFYENNVLVRTRWANGSDAENKIWNDRATYSYD